MDIACDAAVGAAQAFLSVRRGYRFIPKHVFGVPLDVFINEGGKPPAGVVVPDYLLTKYPEEMTIVLQHQFWGLEVRDQDFSVTLSFQNRPEQLTVPFAAVASFADPSVNFALRFEVPAEAPANTPALPAKTPAPKPTEAPRPPAEIVTLDKFRKR